MPTAIPTFAPTTAIPSSMPTAIPTFAPTTATPSASPTTATPSYAPTLPFTTYVISEVMIMNCFLNYIIMFLSLSLISHRNFHHFLFYVRL